MPLYEKHAKLHRIDVVLYPNHLPDVEGKYIARTKNQATVTIEDIGGALRDRAGFSGNLEQLAADLRLFFNEVEYQLADGFTVNLGPFSIHPNVGGTFDSVREGITEEKHPIDFRYRTRAELREVAQFIDVNVVGVAENGAFIDEVYDNASGTANEKMTPGGVIIITGGKIKIAGEAKDTGVYFTAPGSPIITTKVTEHLVENSANKVIAVTPQLPTGKTWTLQVRTQYAGSGTLLKEVRIIPTAFSMTT
jgi:hypothetical protein